MKNRQRAALEIRLDRADLFSVGRGDDGAARRVPLHLNAEATRWARDLLDAAPAMRNEVEALGLQDALATVFCETPSLGLDVISASVRTSREACTSAALAAQETVSYALDAAITEACVIGVDRSGTERKRHVIAAVERDQTAEAIAAFVEAVGMRLDAIVPIDAPVFASVTQRALDHRSGPRGCLHIGELSSFFAVACNGRLRFSRRIALGVSTLVRTLMLELQTRSGETISLNEIDAACLLSEVGIPEHDMVVDQERGLVGAHVIPVLAPVLQRLIVEIRQSIRFGLDDGERAALSVDVIGPGGSIPRLTTVLTEELGINAKTEPDPHELIPHIPASPGSDLAAAIRARQGRSSGLSLLPHRIMKRRRFQRLRHCAWAGAILAMGVVGFDSFRLHSRISQTRATVASMNMHADAVSQLEATRDRLTALQADVGSLGTLLRSEMRSARTYAPALREISQLVERSVFLTALTLAYAENTGPSGSMIGYVMADTVSPEGNNFELRDFLSRLKASPLFSHVALGTVETSEVDGKSALRFDIAVTLTPWAPASLAELVQVQEVSP